MASQTADVLKGYFAAGKFPAATNYGDLIDTIFSSVGGAFKTIEAYNDTTFAALIDGEDLTGVSFVVVKAAESTVKITYQDNGSGQSSWVTITYGQVVLFTPDGWPAIATESDGDSSVIEIAQASQAADPTVTDYAGVFENTIPGKIVFLHNTTNAALAFKYGATGAQKTATIQAGEVLGFVYVNSTLGFYPIGVPIQ